MIRNILFKWDGFDLSGNLHQGEISSQTEILARSELRQLGIHPRSVTRLSILRRLRGEPRIRSVQIADFSRQLSTLLVSGIPLLQALEVIGRGHEHIAMRNLILRVRTQVEKGLPFAESLSMYPQYFGSLFCNLIRIGEQTGILDVLLTKIADQQEKTQLMKNRIQSALTYPVFVVLVAVIVASILLVFVVPQFESLFRGFGAALPAPTLWVMDLSRNFGLISSVLLGLIFLFSYVFLMLKRKSNRFNLWIDSIQLHLPVVGSVLRKVIMARFSRTLSVLISAGVPLNESLISVADACDNRIYHEVVHQVKRQVNSGFSLHKALRSGDYFADRVIHLVAIGEESGSLDIMLEKSADYFEAEVDCKVDALSKLVEPVIMAVLGVLVGGLVLAMYLPLFRLGGMV